MNNTLMYTVPYISRLSLGEVMFGIEQHGYSCICDGDRQEIRVYA